MNSSQQQSNQNNSTAQQQVLYGLNQASPIMGSGNSSQPVSAINGVQPNAAMMNAAKYGFQQRLGVQQAVPNSNPSGNQVTGATQGNQFYPQQYNNFKMMGGNTTSGQMGVTNSASMMQMQMQRNPMEYAGMMNGREEMSQPNPLGFNNLMLPNLGGGSQQFNQKFQSLGALGSNSAQDFNSMNMSISDMNSEGNRSFSQNQSKFDVLKLYDDPQFENQFSIFKGGLDTGIDLGNFTIDTSPYPQEVKSDDPEQRFVERFISPYCRTQLNQRKLLKEEESTSEQRSHYLMDQYFKLLNTHMHGQLGGKVESESFSHNFLLPKCYDMPKFREIPPNSSGQLISPERCKQFPDKVLFYIFYSTPHDKAQVNAATELESRQWIYCQDSMRWIKANSSSKQSSTKDKKKRGNNSKEDTEDASSSRTVIVFNPLLWKEEIVNLIED